MFFLRPIRYLVATFQDRTVTLSGYSPIPKAFPPLLWARMHIAANATTASQISYHVVLVDFPVIPTETWHLASTGQRDMVRIISTILMQMRIRGVGEKNTTHWL